MTGRRRVNRKGRSTSKSIKVKNKILCSRGFAFLTYDVLESDAFRFIGFNAQKILFRLFLEWLDHGGQTNGLLICTYQDFKDYGVTERYIRAALEELKIAGLIRWKSGHFNGQTKPPNVYTITFYNTHDGLAATHDWKGKKMADMKKERTKYKNQCQARKQSKKETTA